MNQDSLESFVSRALQASYTKCDNVVERSAAILGMSDLLKEYNPTENVEINREMDYLAYGEFSFGKINSAIQEKDWKYVTVKVDKLSDFVKEYVQRLQEIILVNDSSEEEKDAAASVLERINGFYKSVDVLANEISFLTTDMVDAKEKIKDMAGDNEQNEILLTYFAQNYYFGRIESQLTQTIDSFMSEFRNLLNHKRDYVSTLLNSSSKEKSAVSFNEYFPSLKSKTYSYLKRLSNI